MLWWDEQEKNKGGGDVRNTRRRSPTSVRAEDYGLDRDTIHRWRSPNGKLDLTQVILAGGQLEMMTLWRLLVQPHAYERRQDY